MMGVSNAFDTPIILRTGKASVKNLSGKHGIHPCIRLPLLDKFSIVRVRRKSIRSINVYDKGQMIRLPGTFGGVCHTPLPKPDKCLLNTYLLNPMLGKDGIHP